MAIEAIYPQLAQRISVLRDMLGVTQQKLADRIGVTRAQIANIESGRSRLMLHQVGEIARSLGTRPDHLMKGLW